MFKLDLINIIVLVSLAIHASLLVVLFHYGSKTPGGKAYTVAILAIVGWIFPMAMYRSNLFGDAELWARLLYAMASLTSSSFLFFTFVFPEDKKIPRWIEALLFVENILIILLCFHPTWLIRGVEVLPRSENHIIWGPLYPIYSLHISGLFLMGFIILFLKRKKSIGLVRTQISFILGGYFIAANLAMITNLVLPWFGYFELNWLGQFFSTLVAILTTYAILKHNLLYIRVIATEGFLIILNILLFVQILFAVSQGQFVVQLIVFVAFVGVSYALVRGAGIEVSRNQEIAQLAASLKDSNAELEKTNIQLKDLDQQKTEFLTIAAHQLRTPLSIIKGYVSLLLDGSYGKIKKPVKDVLKNMDDSNQWLIRLADEFLNIARLEQGRTKFIFAPQDVRDIIDGVVLELAAKSAPKGIKIIWHRPHQPLVGEMDEEKIRYAIYNYLDNAIKYSPTSNITISASAADDGIEVVVADHGLGFDRHDQANFFQKFYRGQNVQTTNVNGTGLGLYVCSKFIKGHHGRVWADSPGLGKGSEFGFWIPKILPAVILTNK